MREQMEWQAKHILYEYDLFPRQIAQVREHEWKVKTDHGFFLLKRTGESPAQLYFVASWLHYLYSRGMYTAIPYYISKYGEACISTVAGAYVLQPWVDGARPLPRFPDWESHVLREVGRIHKISAQAEQGWDGYAPVSLDTIKRRWEDGIAHIQKAAQEAGKESTGTGLERMLKESAEHVRHFAEWAIQELEEAAEQIEESALARVLCHGRIHRSNLLQDADGRIYFLNFERANLDTPIRDIALFFRRYAPQYQWNIRKGREWLAAYETERLLTKEERQLLSCYLLFPERLAQVARAYVRETGEEREEYVRKLLKTWQKHLGFLPKMHQFAFAIAQK
ncbi:phosphotransferase [Aneurinibacillus sp. BA2021]|nr:phosphotransferase [Aneurinibacillus sp. BA2021]